MKKLIIYNVENNILGPKWTSLFWWLPLIEGAKPHGQYIQWNKHESKEIEYFSPYPDHEQARGKII